MGKEENQHKTLDEIARQVGLGHFEMHFFLCAGPDCCTPEQGAASWQALKATIKRLYPSLPEARIYRTKAGCLRMCREGPIAVCYPQGRWFRGVSAACVDGVITHLAEGRETPHELEFAAHPLPKP